ncbi:MAG: hypothetical protein OSA98_12930 [Rubripirellula sp.]|jgi:hypothetical protein|nr:hypothetical protein [Rubripirellula sp.]|tara:strand:- start:245 stop:802 length:558 start_codon:yes stop_codon:yes gene_type:complete
MDTSETSRHAIDEVDLLLANARLRDELEPYRDESIDDPSVARMSLRTENEYLASMLAWERAPALPIANWFAPAMELPIPDSLDDESLSQVLRQAIARLYSQKVVLRFTDHLSDRELYKIVYRDILQCCEKKVELPGKFLEWRCIEDNDTWLRYYADAIERRRFQEEHDVDLPAAETPGYKRNLPG